MIGFYNYTVILTYIGLISTFVGITQVFEGNFMVAIFCLILSGVCDMFDGVVARTHKTRSEQAQKFGIQIDSLCDVICFGVFPAVFNYAYTRMINPELNIVAAIVSSFFVLCAVIRLGFFNVMEEERQKQTNELRKMYQGMPVTTVAGFLPLLYMFRNRLAAVNIDFYIILNVFCVALGFLYILNIPVPKAHKRGIIAMSIIGVVMITVLLLQFFGKISF